MVENIITKLIPKEGICPKCQTTGEHVSKGFDGVNVTQTFNCPNCDTNWVAFYELVCTNVSIIS